MVKLLPIHELPQDLLRRRIDAQNTLNACDKEIERIVLEHAGLKVGDVLEEPDSGLRYELSHASAHITNSGELGPATGISLRGRRVYKTGRKAGKTARSDWSHISSRAEKVEE